MQTNKDEIKNDEVTKKVSTVTDINIKRHKNTKLLTHTQKQTKINMTKWKTCF